MGAAGLGDLLAGRPSPAGTGPISAPRRFWVDLSVTQVFPAPPAQLHWLLWGSRSGGGGSWARGQSGGPHPRVGTCVWQGGSERQKPPRHLPRPSDSGVRPLQPCLPPTSLKTPGPHSERRASAPPATPAPKSVCPLQRSSDSVHPPASHRLVPRPGRLVGLGKHGQRAGDPRTQ